MHFVARVLSKPENGGLATHLKLTCPGNVGLQLTFGVFYMSFTGCSSNNQEAVISVEMMGIKVYLKKSR